MSIYVHFLILWYKPKHLATKKKYYVVWNGVTPGIYDTWNKCKLQIQGYPSARYKSFKTRAEAEEAYMAGANASISSKTYSSDKNQDYKNYLSEIILPSLSVDAACSGNPGIVEYQGVDTESKIVFFKKGPFNKGTNNLGEFLALIHALAYLKKKGDLNMTVYSDSRTAMSWLRNRKVKTTFFNKYKNDELLDLVNRAIRWMDQNRTYNPVKKWNTKKWGEIPADFGRK